MFVFKYLLAVILLSIGVQSIDNEGQPCYHVTKNLTGTCTLLINCASAFQEVQKQVLPQICDLAATAPIVCCPKIPVGYIANAKCIEYSKLRKGKCNIQFDRSVNITTAVGKEFPHMAIFGYSGTGAGRRYTCGGPLISERFILTRAGCVIWRSQPKYVRLGDLILQNDEDDADPQEFKIDQIIVHPKFDQILGDNNIALIKLDRNVEFTEYVFPACLHVGREFDASRKLLHAGWWYENPNRQLGRILLKLADHKCRKDRDLFICTESDEPTCVGDYGNSLQILRRDVDCMYDMIGITKSCAFDDNPQTFARISHYIEWIEKIVWP